MKLQQITDALSAALDVVAAHFAAMGAADIALSLVMSAGLVWVGWWCQRGLGKFFRGLSVSPAEADSANHAKWSRQAAQLSRFSTGSVIVVGVLAGLAAIWDVSLPAMFAMFDDAQLTSRLFRIGMLLVLTFIAFEVLGFVIKRGFSSVARKSHDPRRTAQILTISPILSSICQALVVVFGTILILSELGVQIAPLLAGAGIIGIAIGFGAQTLVKDFITGVFLIVEDILSVGDVVQIATFSGTVEAMTFRTVRLRDFDGTLHVFPYSEAQVIHNKTNKFSYYVFTFQLAMTVNVDDVIAILKQVGSEMRSDPVFGPSITNDIEVVGVDSLQDASVVLKARIRTLPGKQWPIGREMNRRIKAAFEAGGVDMPIQQMQLLNPIGSLPSAIPPSPADEIAG